jgi:hypothetical protein
MMPRAEVAGQCGCGRSPTGKCCGWHALSEDAYKQAKSDYELEEYKRQAQALWNDSCTSPRANDQN